MGLWWHHRNLGQHPTNDHFASFLATVAEICFTPFETTFRIRRLWSMVSKVEITPSIRPFSMPATYEAASRSLDE